MSDLGAGSQRRDGEECRLEAAAGGTAAAAGHVAERGRGTPAVCGGTSGTSECLCTGTPVRKHFGLVPDANQPEEFVDDATR
jgi:hypothetical protein